MEKTRLLTDLAINNLETTGKEYTVKPKETGASTLYLRVSAKGVKTFTYRYRSPQGRDTWLTMGNYPAMSLHDARKLATDYALMRKLGIDPAEQVQAEKVAKQAQAKELALNPTFENVTQLFYERVISRRRRPEQFLWAVQKYVFPYIGTVRVSELTRGQVAEVINRIVDNRTPVMANRVLAMVKAVTRYAAEQGHCDTDPAAGFTRASAGGKEKPRNRVLTTDEIRKLLLALDADAPAGRRLSLQVRCALLWLLMSGQRISETLSAQWDHIRDGLWNLPAENTMGQRTHFVHVTPLMAAILDELRPLTGTSRYIFASSRDSKRYMAKETVQNALSRLLNDGTIQVRKFSPHDLRRTMVTRMSDLGIAPHVIEKIVNHKMAGVMGIYNRSEYLPERQEAIELWNLRLQELMGACGNVVYMARG